MKPFDLEAAKRGEPIQYRDGTPARFLLYVPEAYEDCRVFALREGMVTTHDINGRWAKTRVGEWDLLMAPKPAKNIYLSVWRDNVKELRYTVTETPLFVAQPVYPWILYNHEIRIDE